MLDKPNSVYAETKYEGNVQSRSYAVLEAAAKILLANYNRMPPNAIHRCLGITDAKRRMNASNAVH